MPTNPQARDLTATRGRLNPRLALMVVLALAPAAVLGVYICCQQHRASVARVNADALRAAELVAASQQGLAEGTRQLLATLTELPLVQTNTSRPFLHSVFRNLLKLSPACVEFGLLQRDGQWLASSLPVAPEGGFPHEPLLRKVLASRRLVVAGGAPGATNQPAGVWFGQPVLDGAGEVSRVLYAVVGVEALTEAANRTRLPRGAELTICDARDAVLARWPERSHPSSPTGNAPPFHLARNEATAMEGLTGLDGGGLFFAYAPVRVGSSAPLAVWVGIPKAGAYAETRDALVLTLLLLGMVAVVAWVAARWYASVRILKPVRQLVAAAERLGADDWTARTGLSHSRGELGLLARTFDDLACTLQRKQAESERAAAELRAAEIKFRTLVEQSLVGIYIIQDGNFAYVNPRFGDIVGRKPEELIGKPVLDIVAEPDRALVEGNIRKRLQGELPSIRYHLRCVRPDGSPVPVEVHGAAAEVNGRRAIIGALLDVTEQVQAEAEIRRLNAELEQRVALRTAQLEAANNELEAFAYSVSHDLRAPLRHISGFVELLAGSAGGRLDERGARYLKTIADSARQMGRLIDDLLDFARMGRARMNTARVDLEELVGAARAELEPDTRGRNIVWKNGGLPEVEGDPAMLKQVFLNLLSNAVKYTRQRDPAVIELGTENANTEEIIVFIRDNGAGFDMRYAHKLFGVFQRLHRADEFEGTGIGLANVRRIIARHGGRTWATGEPGKGATFYFSLPNHHASQGTHGTQTNPPG